jgi:SAM-dependent methyltransferase
MSDPEEPFSAREEYFIASEREHWDAYYQKVPVGSEWIPDTSRTHCPVAEFHRRLYAHDARRVLSVGGGIDYLAAHLARRGATVVSIDVSSVATAKTRDLAARLGLSHRLTARTVACERFDAEAEFDLVVATGALHHMNWERAIRRIHAALRPGGVLMTREPVTLSRLLEIWQRYVVIRPPYAKPTPLEFMVSPGHIAFVEGLFSRIELDYFQLLNRDMFYGLWRRTGLERFRARFGEWDYRLIKRVPALQKYVQDATIEAWK